MAAKEGGVFEAKIGQRSMLIGINSAANRQ